MMEVSIEELMLYYYINVLLSKEDENLELIYEWIIRKKVAVKMASTITDI